MAALTGKRRRAPLTESGSVVAVRVDISEYGNMRTWATVEGVGGSSAPHLGKSGQSQVGRLFQTLQDQGGKEWFQRKYCGTNTQDARDEIKRLALLAMQEIILRNNWNRHRKSRTFLSRLQVKMEEKYPGKTGNIYIDGRNDLIDHEVLGELVRQSQNDQNQANLRVSSGGYPALGAAASVQTPDRPRPPEERNFSGFAKQTTIGAAVQIEMEVIGRPHIHIFLKLPNHNYTVNTSNILRCLGMVRTTRFAPADSRNDKRFKKKQKEKDMTTPRTMRRVQRALMPVGEEDEDEDMAGSAAGKNGLVDMLENLTF